MAEKENEPSQLNSAHGVVLILCGLAVAFLSPYWIEFDPGEFLVSPHWYIGWLMVAFGAWLFPNRLVAGVFIGFAAASIGYFFLLWYSMRGGMG
jgi:hypothetical protein